MNRPFHTIQRRSVTVVWLLAGLLLVLPAGQHVAAGIILCIGADGHVDIEDGRYGDCGRAPFSKQAHHEAHTGGGEWALSAATDSDPSEDCDDCFDVALLVNPTENRIAKTKKASVLLAPLVRTSPDGLFASARDPSAPATPPMTPSPALAELSTVVLLA